MLSFSPPPCYCSTCRNIWFFHQKSKWEWLYRNTLIISCTFFHLFMYLNWLTETFWAVITFLTLEGKSLLGFLPVDETKLFLTLEVFSWSVWAIWTILVRWLDDSLKPGKSKALLDLYIDIFCAFFLGSALRKSDTWLTKRGKAITL